MISVAEKTLSGVKRRGGRTKGQLTKMYLAVYPYEIEFYSSVPFKSSLFFEKNYQVLGQVKEILPSGQKRQKIQLTNIKNLIFFRLSSQNNIVYKWSIYRLNDDEELEFLDSFAINLKEVVSSFTNGKVSRSDTTSYSQLAKIGFIRKQMRVKFLKADICLFYNIFAAENQLQIREYVTRKFINREEDAVIEQNFLKTDSSMNIGLSSRKYPSIMKKGSDPLGQHTSSNQKNNLLESSSGFNSKIPLNTKKDDQVLKATTSQNLQNIILNFDAAGTITESKQQNLHIHSNQLDSKEKVDPDMVFELKSSNDAKSNEATINTQSKREDNTLFNSRDYGMLKLQSDQGRVKQDPLDKKLQMAELEAIQEEKPSKQVTNNFSSEQTGINNYKERVNRMKAKKKSTIKQESFQLQIKEKKPNFKRMVYALIFSLLFFVLAAVLLQGKKKKEKKDRNKPKKSSRK